MNAVHGAIIAQTFDEKSRGLPSEVEFFKSVYLDHMHGNMGGDIHARVESHMESILFRHQYVNHSFPILTKEWVNDLAIFLLAYSQRTAEVASGSGWLSHWLQACGVVIEHTIDDHSWNDSGSEIRFDFQPWVTKGDGVEFVKDHPEIDTLILSWPDMDSMAANTFKAMVPGQTLIYIGEWHHGCTADEEFFDLIDGKTLKSDLNKNFLSFFGIHDHVVVVRA
jgi:hypothetical protein